MLNTQEIQKSVRAQVFGHWSVLGPLVGASLPISYGLFIADNWQVPVFGGLVCIAGSVGSFLYRFFLKREDLTIAETEKAKNKFEQERNLIANKRERELDEFRRKLASDDSGRDENLLDGLRGIAKAFRSDRTWVENVPETLSTEVLARVDSTFEASIANLDRAFNLRQTSRNVRGEGKEELIKTSDALLDKVQADTEGLGKYLAAVTKLSIRRLTGATLEQSDSDTNMQELRGLLSAAEKAEDMRQQFISGPSGDAQKYAEYENADKHA